MNTYCCGCAYRFPEPDDDKHPRLAASSYDTLRKWQLREMAPKLVGLPVFINHEMGDNSSSNSIVTGNRALGKITHAWVDTQDGSLHWVGKLTFLPEDRLVMSMYNAGLIPMCSLQHTVSDLNRPPYVITPIEISICHRGRRPGTHISRGGNPETYMRNNGYVAIKAMAFDFVLPDSTELFAEAARITETNTLQAAHKLEIDKLHAQLQEAAAKETELCKTILAHEGAIKKNQESAMNELNEAEKIFSALAKQVFPTSFDTIIKPPISIAASWTGSDIQEYTQKVRKANALMEARKIAQETIAANKPLPIVVTASAKRPAETQSMRMSESQVYTGSGAKMIKVFDLDSQAVPTFT